MYLNSIHYGNVIMLHNNNINVFTLLLLHYIMGM